MNFITVPTDAGNVIIDVYNIAVILPGEKTTIELYKGEDVVCNITVDEVSALITTARNQAIPQ